MSNFPVRIFPCCRAMQDAIEDKWVEIEAKPKSIAYLVFKSPENEKNRIALAACPFCGDWLSNEKTPNGGIKNRNLARPSYNDVPDDYIGSQHVWVEGSITNNFPCCDEMEDAINKKWIEVSIRGTTSEKSAWFIFRPILGSKDRMLGTKENLFLFLTCCPFCGEWLSIMKSRINIEDGKK